MFVKPFDVYSANTLPPECIGKNESGWVICGKIYEDEFEWVNEFEATHPIYGRVWGDFESGVYADSESGYNHFIENHPPTEWDYDDI